MKNNKIFISIIMIIVIFFSNCSFAVETELEIETPSAILIEAKTGRVLYEKNSNEKMFPASTTKIMTAILTLEHVQDLQEKAVVSYEAVYTVPVRIFYRYS